MLTGTSEVLGGAYKGLVERIVALILTLQRTCSPGSLICVRLTRGFEVDFEDLIEAFGRLVDDSGNTPRAGEAEITHDLGFPAGRWSRNNPKPRVSSAPQVPLKPQHTIN